MSTIWTPAEITTSLWLDAADSGTITIATGVSQWRDKSGNGNHANQATASLQPAVTPAGLNGLDTLFFDGSAALLVNGLTTPATCNSFVVWTKPVQGGVAYQRIFSSGPATTDDYLANGVYEMSPTGNNGIYAGGPGVISNSWGGASKALENFYLGRANRTAGYYYYGQLAELLLTPNLSLSHFQAVQGYLAWRWGIVASLAADHPYKTEAPSIFTLAGNVVVSDVPVQRTVLIYKNAETSPHVTVQSDPETGDWTATAAGTSSDRYRVLIVGETGEFSRVFEAVAAG